MHRLVSWKPFGKGACSIVLQRYCDGRGLGSLPNVNTIVTSVTAESSAGHNLNVPQQHPGPLQLSPKGCSLLPHCPQQAVQQI